VASANSILAGVWRTSFLVGACRRRCLEALSCRDVDVPKSKLLQPPSWHLLLGIDVPKLAATTSWRLGGPLMHHVRGRPKSKV
jgi:hypothetical protein